MMIILLDMDLPNTTLAARILFLIGVGIHVVMTMGYYGGQAGSPANFEGSK
jgi:hypothetical protein